MKKYWAALLGMVLITYILWINIISGVRIAFSFPIVILGLLLILYHFCKNRIKESKFMSKGFKYLRIFICIGLIFFFAMEVLIISFPKHNQKKDDYIIVLGAGLANRTNPTEILRARLDVAIKCWKENENAYLVMSGGQGIDEDLPEAVAMSKYLQDRGVNKDKIIVEDKSRDTNQNFKFSKEKIESHSKKVLREVDVKIVTTDFHAFRSSILAKKNGYVNYDNYSSPTVWYLIPITYTREAFAIVKSVFFDN